MTAPPTRTARRIAVIGGGFSGAGFALHLARRVTREVSVDIIEPRPVLGGGVAYSAADPAHRINVPAVKMSVFAEDPEHFDRWLRETNSIAEDPAALWGESQLYAGRAVFGRYMAAQLATVPPHIRIRHIRSRALGAHRHGAGYRIQLENGDTQDADFLVLATSHPPPAVPRQISDVLGNRTDGPLLIGDPWQAGALDAVAPEAAVLIMGTALSMADVVATLDRQGHRGRILAFSRRGLLSRGHVRTPFEPIDRFRDVPRTGTALDLLIQVRRGIRDAAAEGLPWQAVLDDVRINGQTIWQGMALAERRHLLRHLRAFWDVHRYRVAPQVEAAIEKRRADGSLEVAAASLAGIAVVDGAFEAVLRSRPAARLPDRMFRADALVVTTGPAHGSVIATNRILADLAEQGLIRPDTLGLGLDSDPTGRVLDISGEPNPTLCVAGPLARAVYGELMGLPQVSLHAETVAEYAAGWIAAPSAP